MGKAQLASNRWLILCQTKRVAHARNLAHLFSLVVCLAFNLRNNMIPFFTKFYNFYKRFKFFLNAEKDNNRHDRYNSATKQVSLTFESDCNVASFIKCYKKAKKGRQHCQGKYNTVTQQVFLSWNRILIAFCSYNLPPLCDHLPHVFLGSFSVFCFCSEVTFDLPKKGCCWSVGLLDQKFF